MLYYWCCGKLELKKQALHIDELEVYYIVVTSDRPYGVEEQKNLKKVLYIPKGKLYNMA